MWVAENVGAATTWAPNSDHFRYTGRFDFSDPLKPRFDWPATTIEAAFTGTSATILISGGDNNFDIFVDGVKKDTLVLRSNVTSYAITGLSAGAHQLRLSKRTESVYGPAVFAGLTVEDNQGEATLPAKPAAKILFIGDSYTAGYGVDAKTVSCGERRPYDNANLAYGPVTARTLNADFQVIAISGKGMVHNYGDTKPISDEPMPLYFDRTLYAKPEGKWDFPSWIPDVVVVALGSNDFSTQVKPSLEQYTSAYQAFYNTLRQHYPNAQLVGLTYAIDSYQPAYVDTLVKRWTAKGDTKVKQVRFPSFGNTDLGCDYHPNFNLQQKFADILVPAVRQLLASSEVRRPLFPKQKERRLNRRSWVELDRDGLGRSRFDLSRRGHYTAFLPE